MQPKKKIEPMGITALYCRLSRDDGVDGDEGESELTPIKNILNDNIA